MQNRRLLPYLSLASGILALSLSAMFVRWAKAPGAVTGFYRFFFSTLILTPFFIQRQHQSGSLQISVLIFPILAGFFTAFDLTIWNTSLAFTTASNATLLGNTAPLWVALGAWLLFKEKLTNLFWFGLLFALSGAALIMGGDFLLHPRLGIGDLMAASAGIFYASYMLSTQRGRRCIDPFRYTWLVGVVASFTTFTVNIILNNPLTGFDAMTWWIFLGAALISQTIGYISISYALGHLPARVVSPTLIGQPIMTTILAVPLLGEIPTSLQILGGLIALAGIYLVNQSHSQREEENQNA